MTGTIAASILRSVSPMMLGTALALSAPAYAQTAPEAAGDIVVTASKRSERLLEVPGAVTAVDAGQLIQTQRVSITDYYTQVPGLSISDSGNGRTSLAIRGVTTGNIQRATVGIVIDDVPFTSTGGTNVSPNLTPDLDPAILQRIEVLRGPQGTLYGAATLGGLLKFVTITPSLDTISGFAQADISSVAHGDLGYSARVSMNGPLVEGALGISASGFYRRDPGFIDNATRGLKDINGADNYGGRVELRWKIDDRFELRVAGLAQLTDSDGQTTIRTSYDLKPVAPGLDATAHPGTGDRKSEIDFFTATLTGDFGGFGITSLTGYLHNSYTQDTIGTVNQYAASTALFGVNGNFIRNVYRIDKFSQELRFHSNGDGPLQWMIGGFYTDEKSYSLQQGYAISPQTGATPGIFFEFYFPSTFEEVAGFGDLTWQVTDRLQVQGGIRYSSNRQTYYEEDRGPRYVPPIIIDKKSKDNVTTYLASIRYEFTDDLMVYARVASGYRPGGPQTAAFGDVVPSQVDPDTTVNYEIGIKGQLFDKRFEFDIAGYRIDWDDIQLSQTLPDYGFFYINGGKARIQGIEGSVQARPFPGTVIAGNFAYTDSELRTPAVGFVGAVGDRLPWSSKWTFNIAADQTVRLGGTAEGFVGATLSYVGGRLGVFPTSASNVRQYFPSYTTLDARIGVRFDDRYTVTVFGRNLTDELGFLSSNVNQGSANMTSLYSTSIIRPRTIGMSFGVDF